MALIGPAMADYMRTGQLDISEINEVHKQLRTPIVPIMEQPIAQLPEPAAPVEIVPLQAPEVLLSVAPETEPVVNEAPVQEMPLQSAHLYPRRSSRTDACSTSPPLAPPVGRRVLHHLL